MEIKYSNGNRKIGRDTIIINMGSATDCASKRLGLCKVCARCYAVKAERQYPSCLPYRRLQAKIWSYTSAESIASQILGIAGVKSGRVKYLRFSESGDFRTQGDVDKMSTVAKLLAGKLIVWGYTARSDLDFSRVSDNLVVNGSGFMLHNNFVAVPKFTGNNLLCGGEGSCEECKLCKVRLHKTIEVEYH